MNYMQTTNQSQNIYDTRRRTKDCKIQIKIKNKIGINTPIVNKVETTRLEYGTHIPLSLL